MSVQTSPSPATTPSSSSAPLTPVSLDGAFPSSLANQLSAQQQRKPNRRANTAERRATHNAVERQRRETLNSRFLDLAALLPNLVSVRRPSKSAIVNSSIALIHAQRRARCNAGRELRALKAEADALRREVNEWRERTGAGARVEEPARSSEFVALTQVEDEYEEDADEEYYLSSGMMQQEEDDLLDDEPLVAGPAPQTVPTSVPASGPRSAHEATQFIPPSPQSVSFSDPAAAEKLAAWNAQIYAAFAQQSQFRAQAAQAALFGNPNAAPPTPPGSAHGHGHMQGITAHMGVNPGAGNPFVGAFGQFPRANGEMSTTPPVISPLGGFDADAFMAFRQPNQQPQQPQFAHQWSDVAKAPFHMGPLMI